jgi:serine/threonine-protein kinase
MALGEGSTLGRYEIRSLLGKGGMGEVYLAHDPSLRRIVAIKTLRSDLTADDSRLKRFEREAYSASSLNHPNILTIFEFGKEGERHFIVTEAVDGHSLSHLIKTTFFSLGDVLDISIQVCSALAAAHAAGIIHRDIKPDNIMLRQDRLVKVLDFGLAKLNDAGEDQAQVDAGFATNPSLILGTPRYMSPEQARGLPLDARTDIWSLGVVIYNLLTGILPFEGQTPSDVLVAVLSVQPPPISRYLEGSPVELQRIVTKTLAKDKDARYQSITELEEDLKAVRQRLEFERELKRSQSGSASGADRQFDDTKLDRTVVLDRADQAISSVADSTLIRSESSAEYLVRGIKRHKLVASAIAVLLFAAATTIAILTLSGTSEAGIKSLAVLPFTNTSSDPGKEYLSDGISESLTNRLSQLPGVKVIANSSTARYKGKEPDPHDVGRELDVSGILTGKVSERGDSITIIVELIDTRDRTQVWGEQYNRKTKDLFAVQSEISNVITEKLRLRLTQGQQQDLARQENVNPDAYELLLKGRFYRFRGGLEDRKRAAEYFQQCTVLDPYYAPAYADLADIYRSLVGSSVFNPKEYLPKAEAAARKALELDINLADAHYALGNLMTYEWRWAEAEERYKRALHLNPNHALAHRWYATYLRLLGRHEQAIAEITRARELDPLSPALNATVGFVLSSARKYDQAIEVLTKTLDLDGEYPYTHLFLSFAYAGKERYAQAVAACEDAIRLGLNTPITRVFLGTLYARAGQREKADAILKQLQASTEYVSPAELATLFAALGDREQAFASLQKAYESRDPQLQQLGVNAGFDSLRDDPRFKDLMTKVGLTP